MILQNNTTLSVESNDEQEILYDCHKKTPKNCLNTNAIKNSDKLRELFDTLCTLSSKTSKFNFDFELISYRNDKSQFLTGLSKLQSFLKAENCKITNGEGFEDPGFSEALCHYLLELVCEADFNSTSKNYSNKIISILKVIPTSSKHVYTFLIGLSTTSDLSINQFKRDVQIRLCKIYIILTLNLIQTLNKDEVSKLFDSITSLYLSISNNSLYNDKDDNHLQNSTHSKTEGFQTGGVLQGLKCINLLLYSKLMRSYDVNNKLVNELISNLEFTLLNESKNYQLVSSSAICYIASLLILVYKEEDERILSIVTTAHGSEDKYTDREKHLEKIGKFIKKLTNSNYIYTVRAVLLYLYNTQNLDYDNNVFTNPVKTKILINCYKIIRDYTKNNNNFLVNYSILQTIQSYTLFLNNNNKEGNKSDLFDSNCRDKISQDDKEEGSVADEVEVDMREYLESLLDLSNCLVDFFNNKIKTINHLAMYIYKKLINSVFPRYSMYYNKPEGPDVTDDVSNSYLARDGLVEKMMESMRKSTTVRSKYVILETVVNMNNLEKVIEMEPYLILHLIFNITNNKCTITSLLSQVLSQVKEIFRNIHGKEVIENSENNKHMKDTIRSILCLRGDEEVEEGLVEIVFKCYIYPVLIVVIKGYEVRFEKTGSIYTFYPVNLEVKENEESEDTKIERWKCINKIMSKIIPNYIFELFKMSNDRYEFEYLEYLPENYKSILSEKGVCANKLPLNLKKFYRDVLDNMCKIGGKDNMNYLKCENNKDIEKYGDFEKEIEKESVIGKMVMSEFTDNDVFTKWIDKANLVEIRGNISYLQSMCMCNFRKMNKMYFVNIVRGDKTYNGIFISNHHENMNKDLLKLQERELGEDIYFIDINTYMWNLYHSESVEIVLNLLKSITDYKKVSKVVTLNEFKLVKFVLKNVIQSINLSNQNYFIQLIESFFERINYNLKSVNNSRIPGSNNNNLCNQNDLNGIENKKLNGLEIDNRDFKRNLMGNEKIKDYLVESINEILKILHTNIQLYNNENRIMMSVSIIKRLFNLLIEKGESTKDLWKKLGMCQEGIYSSLNRLFLQLKPYYHSIIYGVMDYFYSSKVGMVVREKLCDLSRILFQINQNKYEMASNMMLLVVKRVEYREMSLLLNCIQEAYFKNVKRVQVHIDDYDYMDHCKIGNERKNSEYPLKMFLKVVQSILSHYLENIDVMLEENVTVSGLIHLLSNTLRNNTVNVEHMEGDLNKMYVMLVNTLRHLIKNYLSPNRINGNEVNNGDKGVLDCRGYRITREFEDKLKLEKSNVRISYERCNYHVNSINGDNKNPDKLDFQNKCRINTRVDMDNKNEFKVFNYVVYKLAKELTGALQSILIIFTSENGLLMDNETKSLSKVEEIRKKLEELINLLLYCIINCRHVGCNDIFNNLLLMAMEKLGNIEQSTKFLKKYVSWLIYLMIREDDENENYGLIFGILDGVQDDLKNLKVIDINTRSEHLSMIFITIIKAEGNKKLSNLNIKIIKTLIHIIHKLEEDDHYDNNDNANGYNDYPNKNHNEDDEVIQMIDDLFQSKRVNYKCNGNSSNKEGSIEEWKELEKNNKIINVLNILRYIYRCIDLKYMSTDQLWEVILVSLGQLESRKWSVKNASSLLLSTVLEGISSNPYILNSCTFSIGDLLMKLTRTDEINEKSKLDEKYEGKKTEESIYYTLYVLKIIMETSELINNENITLTSEEFECVKRLLGSRSLHIRTMSASVLCLFLNHFSCSLDEFSVLENDLFSIKNDNNRLNGYLMLVKMLLQSNDGKNVWVNQYVTNLLRRKEFLKKLGEIRNLGIALENQILLLQIIKILNDQSNMDMNSSNFTIDDIGSFKVDNNYNSYYNYHQCKLVQVQGHLGLEYLKQLMSIKDSSLYVVIKCLKTITERSEFTWDLLELLYQYLTDKPRFLELFNYFFLVHNGLLEEQMRINYKDLTDVWKRFYDKKYHNVVKFCLNNLLISRKDIYINVFKSLYYHFLFVSGCNKTIKVGSLVDKKRMMNRLRDFNCMLLKNNTSEMELPERLEIAKLYKETFSTKNYFSINNKNIDNSNDNEITQILKNCLSLVFVNVIILLHDDNSEVRRHIRKLITNLEVNGNSYNYENIYTSSDDSISIINHNHNQYTGFEMSLLNYINTVAEFEVLLEIFLFLLTNTPESNNFMNNNDHNHEDVDYQTREELYEKEENNMYKEEVLIAKNIYTIIINHILKRVRISEIYSFVNKAIETIKEKNISLFKNIKVGSKMDLDKHKVKDIISFFTLSSIKIYILINEDKKDVTIPFSNDIDAFDYSCLDRSEKSGINKTEETEEILYFLGYLEIIAIYQRFLNLYQDCGLRRSKVCTDSTELLLELRNSLTLL